MFIGEIIPEMIYEKPTNNVGGWSYAARPEAEDSKFYELDGEWLYVVKDKAELESLRDQGTWMTSTDPNQLVSITDKDNITKSIPMNNLVTTRVSDMSGLFNLQSNFNQYINNWDVQNVTNMYEMFYNTSFNQNIGWDVSNVTSMSGMFRNSPFNKPIENWDVQNVGDMIQMFYDNSVFNQDLSSWCVSSVTNHIAFDTGATSWTLPKPNFANPPC